MMGLLFGSSYFLQTIFYSQDSAEDWLCCLKQGLTTELDAQSSIENWHLNNVLPPEDCKHFQLKNTYVNMDDLKKSPSMQSLNSKPWETWRTKVTCLQNFLNPQLTISKEGEVDEIPDKATSGSTKVSSNLHTLLRHMSLCTHHTHTLIINNIIVIVIIINNFN